MLGLVWFLVNFAVDQLMFSRGPMSMSFSDHLAAIGVTYLLIPVIPVGFGALLRERA